MARAALNYQSLAEVFSSQSIATKFSKKSKNNKASSKNEKLEERILDLPYSDHLMRVQDEHRERTRREERKEKLLEKIAENSENNQSAELSVAESSQCIIKHRSELLTDVTQAFRRINSCSDFQNL
jgi:hypothetical protein